MKKVLVLLLGGCVLVSAETVRSRWGDVVRRGQTHSMGYGGSREA